MSTFGEDGPGTGPPEDATSTADPARRTAMPHAPLAPGAMLGGRFRIVALLGRGGMGEVYRAEDLRLGQPVALKFLPGPIDEARLQRFYTEVRLGRQVAHPNVCRIYDLAEADGRHFLAMEYVDGEDLASLLRRIGRLPPDKALDLARGICSGLAASHDKGVLHRDLKPANVMVDGRGQPRITDFGLAAAPGDAAAELAGTPAYMAPEQLAGEAATVRSDLYALGLVLYEMFTGRRRFQAATLRELIESHRAAGPPTLTDVGGLPAGVERAIARCLDEDPEGRPESARALLAALPGGDPLEAALAAGETPSPAMVAAAGAVGDLPPARAWAGLALTLAGLAVFALGSSHTLLVRRVPLPKSPDVLVERARSSAAAFGYEAAGGDGAVGFEIDDELLAHVAEDPSPARWDGLAAVRPPPLRFYYRWSPASLLAASAEGRVVRGDPPFDVPGMMDVSLDPQGRLIEFAAVPPLVSAAASTPPAPDWDAAFAQAGLDRATFTPAPPTWSAPVDNDLKASWESKAPALRIDAAARQGRIVWWRLGGPWTRPPSDAGANPGSRAARLVFLAFIVVFQVGGILLARANLRAGRGDRRGAWRLAWCVFAARFVAGLLRADHTAEAWDVHERVVTIVSVALWWAAVAWVVYVGAEPHIRRRWPHMLISWSRLLAGRWRDPMVGRDVLAGGLAGVWLAVAMVAAVFAVPAVVGTAPPGPIANIVTPLAGLRHMLFFVASNVPAAIVQGLSVPSLLLILRAVLRSDAAALAGLYAFGTAYIFLQASRVAGAPAALAIAAVFAAVLLALVRHVTLLGLVSAAYFVHVLEAAPLTLDVDAWYADRSFLALGVLAAIAGGAFVVSLAGKPALASADLP